MNHHYPRTQQEAMTRLTHLIEVVIPYVRKLDPTKVDHDSYCESGTKCLGGWALYLVGIPFESHRDTSNGPRFAGNILREYYLTDMFTPIDYVVDDDHDMDDDRDQQIRLRRFHERIFGDNSDGGSMYDREGAARMLYKQMDLSWPDDYSSQVEVLTAD